MLRELVMSASDKANKQQRERRLERASKTETLCASSFSLFAPWRERLTFSQRREDKAKGAKD